MFQLDIRSILLVAGVMGVLLSIVLFFLRRSFPAPMRRNLSHWIVAPSLLFGATLLLGTRGVIPDVFSIVLGNAVVWLGALLYYFGSQRFLGHLPAVRPWLALWLLATVLMAWATFYQSNSNLRLLIAVSLLTLISAAHGLFLARHGPAKVATRLCIAVLSLQCVNFFFRGATALDSADGYSLFKDSTVQTVYMTVNSFSTLMLNVGLLLMATDRLLIEFERLATEDSLTGTLTRRAFLTACEEEWERVRRHGRPMSLLMLDLDHFKAVNDKHGHQVGDQVLTQFVQRMRGLLRKPDRLGRYGGEEFVMLLPDTNADDARMVAQRLCDSARADGGSLPTISVSIGVATSSAQDASMDTLLSRADAALYRAKQGGRNRVEMG